jgi:uncharacterized protein (TIGR01244 family)
VGWETTAAGVGEFFQGPKANTASNKHDAPADSFETTAKTSFCLPATQSRAFKQPEEKQTLSAEQLEEYRNQWTRASHVTAKNINATEHKVNFVKIDGKSAQTVAQAGAHAILAAGAPVQYAPHIWMAGQLNDLELKQFLSESKVKKVVNLRHPTESDYLVDEQAICESFGVEFISYPFSFGQAQPEYMDALLHLLHGKNLSDEEPVLIHCKRMRRASAVALSLVHLPSEAHMEHIMAEQHKYCHPEDDKEIVGFMEKYLSAKYHLAAQRSGISQVGPSLFIGPQLNETAFREAVLSNGIRSVINLRGRDEAGTLGFGMLSKEENICRGYGINYYNVPTTPGTAPTAEEKQAVLRLLEAAPSPVLVHCRLGKRSADIFCAGCTPYT